MKSRLVSVFFLSLAVLLGLWSCAPRETEVVFWVTPYYFTDGGTGVDYFLQEVRLLGTFNDWAGSTTNATTTWNNSEPLVYNQGEGRFEALIPLPAGKEIEYTLIVKYRNGDTQEITAPYWPDPYSLHDSSDEYFLGPFDRFVDNGMNNGGHNAEYLVP